MGSFAATCAISGLPIEADDEIRIYLLSENPFEERACDSTGVWFPRTYPLRGRYNDYGSAEEVEEGPARDIWLEGLKLDVVPRGRGDNTVHDVPVDKDMTWDQMLEGIWERRIAVQRDWRGDILIDDLKRMTERHLKEADERIRDVDMDGADAVRTKLRTMVHDLAANRRKCHRIPDGVPTRVRVERALEKAGFVLYGESLTPGPDQDASFMVNKISHGCVRVRFHALRNETFGKDVQFLEQARSALGEYVTAIVAGRGNYANAADLLVFVKPGTEHYFSPYEKSKKPILVQMALVREDIWQALLRVDFDGREGQPVTMQTYYDDIARYTVAYDEQRKEHPLYAGEMLNMEEAFRRSALPAIVGRNAIPFTVGLGTHWELMRRRGPIPPDFLKVVAEFAYIHSVLALSRYYWRPGYTSGPQFGEWSLHQRVLGAMTDVARTNAERQEAEKQEDEATP